MKCFLSAHLRWVLFEIVSYCLRTVKR